MNWWRRLRERDRLERELSAELADHVERHVADLVAAGVAEPEARRRAHLALGGVEQVKEECRDVRGTRWLEEFSSDLRYAGRGLLQKPAFAAVAILSLALGIGANTALFSIVDSLIRRSLPVREPERLVLLENGGTNPIWDRSGIGSTSCSTGPPRGPGRASISRREAKRSPSMASSSAARSSRSSACPPGWAGRSFLGRPAPFRGRPSGRRPRRRILETALRGRSRSRGADAPARSRGVHDHRRRAAGVLRAGSRDRSTSRCRSRPTRSCSLSTMFSTTGAPGGSKSLHGGRTGRPWPRRPTRCGRYRRPSEPRPFPSPDARRSPNT